MCSSAGVCRRLKNIVEALFPAQVSERRLEISQAQPAATEAAQGGGVFHLDLWGVSHKLACTVLIDTACCLQLVFVNSL